MYETIVTEDGRLALVLRLPQNKELAEERVPDVRYCDPIIIDYEEPEDSSRVIIIDLEEGSA